MAVFYQTDIRRSNAEGIWWGCKKNPISFILIYPMLKVFRLRVPCTSDDANVDSISEFQVEALPPDIDALFAPLIAELVSVGFSPAIYHFIHDAASGSRIYWATSFHESGQYVARIHNRYWDTQAKKMRALFPMFFTEFANGSFILSSSGKPDIAAPPTVKMNRMPGAPMPQLFSKHVEIVEAARQSSEVVPVTNHAELIGGCERLHQLQCQFHLKRGFFQQPTEKSIAVAQEHLQRMEDAKVQGSQYPDVLAEIRAIEDKKVSVSQMMILLVISAGLFLFASATRSRWDIALWLVPVLFLHESGHWVAMKLFGYRNMRMFFLPFFGAAVSGQNRNVTGWEKALVSLAGPLPGIAIGLILAACCMSHPVPWVRTVAVLLLVLNVFNLLPFLPLDGGRFLQATLFCRNRWLNAGFLALGVLGLVAASALGFGRLFPYLAISLALAIPSALKTGKITEQFRGTSLPPPAPGDFHIPIWAADPLTAAAKEAFPKHGNRLIAQHVLNIYESVNARPPSAGLTIGLMTIYLSGFMMTVVAGFLLIGTMRGSLADFLKDAATMPRHRVELSSVKVWKGQDRKYGGVLVVTTLPNSSAAAAKFAAITNQLPSTAGALLFGESLILDFAQDSGDASQRWLDKLTAPSVTPFLSSSEGVSIDLSCIVPNAAAGTNLQEDLSSYLGIQIEGAIPPWELDKASAEGQRRTKARLVWNRIHQEMNKAMAEHIQRLVADGTIGSRIASPDQTNQLKAMVAANKAAVELVRRRLAGEYSGTPYAKFVDWERQLSELNYTNTTERSALLERVGAEMGFDASRYASNSASGSDVTCKGLIFRAPSMDITSPLDFLPEMLNWLATNRCSHFKYNLDAVD